MNDKLELELIGKAYEQMCQTRARTDGRLMELESFIVRHYGHAGTTLARQIEGQRSSGVVVTTAPQKHGRPLRTFVHPAAKTPVAVTPAPQQSPSKTRPAADIQADAQPGGRKPTVNVTKTKGCCG